MQESSGPGFRTLSAEPQESRSQLQDAGWFETIVEWISEFPASLGGTPVSHDKMVRLLKEQDRTGPVKITLDNNVFNLYFNTLKAPLPGSDEALIDINYFQFFFSGWPLWTFTLQMLSCGFAVWSSFQSLDTGLPTLSWPAWAMLLCAMFLNKYTLEHKVHDVVVLYCKLRILRKVEDWKVDVRTHRCSGVEPQRAKCLAFIVYAKAVSLFAIFLTTAFIVFLKTTTLEMLQNYAAMSFVAAQPELAFTVLNTQNDRRKLGYGHVKYAAVADYNMEVEFTSSDQVERRLPRLWLTFRALHLLSLFLAILRMPWFSGWLF